MFVSFEDTIYRYNFFSITPGLLLKNYILKKSIRTTIKLNIQLIKFFQKLIFMLDITFFKLLIKGEPVNLPFYLFFLLNPLTNFFFEGSTLSRTPPKLVEVLYTRTFFFGKKKLKKRGRVKRKILRKLVLKNKKID
jgi:hypothetical protein